MTPTRRTLEQAVAHHEAGHAVVAWANGVVEAYLRYCWRLSESAVNNSWCEITALASALLEQKTINYVDAVEIISPGTAALRASLMRAAAKYKAIN